MIHASRNFARPTLSTRAKAISRELFSTARKYVTTVFGPKSREMCLTLTNEGTHA
ncbi:MAG: hypothetical protein U0792_15175 [Gemmataceae bacterium]